jgi:hypothetical protein
MNTTTEQINLMWAQLQLAELKKARSEGDSTKEAEIRKALHQRLGLKIKPL